MTHVASIMIPLTLFTECHSCWQRISLFQDIDEEHTARITPKPLPGTCLLEVKHGGNSEADEGEGRTEVTSLRVGNSSLRLLSVISRAGLARGFGLGGAL